MPRRFGGPQEARVSGVEGVRKGGGGEKVREMMGQFGPGLVGHSVTIGSILGEVLSRGQA